MKKLLVTAHLWLIPCFVSGFSAMTINPVVVQVADEQGNPIAGASVKLTESRLEGMLERETESDRRRLLEAALEEQVTDPLGMALVFCGSKFIPAGKADGIATWLIGTLHVAAEGYAPQKIKIEKHHFTAPEGQTKLVVAIEVTLVRAKER